LYLENFFIVLFAVFCNNAFLYLFNFNINNNKDNSKDNNKDNINNIIEAIYNIIKEDK